MARKVKDLVKEPAQSDVVSAAKKFFQRCLTAEEDQRSDELDDIRFVGLLEQWPENIRFLREADPQGARPCLTVDKVNQYKNQIVNNIRQNRPGIKVRPVDDKGDPEVAEVLQGIINHIEDSSNADVAYDWAAEGAVTSGIGFFRILTEYIGESFDQDIRIKRISNRFSVYFDPDSKSPDGSDATQVLITEMIARDDFKRDYPDADPCPWESSTGDNNAWIAEDEVRIAEYFYIEQVKDELYLLEDGNSIYASKYKEKYQPESETGEQPEDYENLAPLEPQQAIPQVIKSRPAYRKVVKWCKLTAADELESTIIPGEYIPVVPVIGIETIVDGKRYLRGIVRGVKDAQRMYNYNRSTIAESLNLTIKAPFIGYTGQFKTASDKWASANRVNYAYLEADPISVNGTLAPLPQRQGFAGVPTGLMQDIQTSEHDIQSALGMYASNIAQDSQAKSGRAITAQRQVGDMATFHFPDNQGRSIRHAGQIILGMIPSIYDTARIVRILGEDGSTDHAQINPDATQPVTEQRDEMGAIKKIYNIGMGRYDVTISTGPSYASKRQEGADFMTQLVQTSPDLMPVIGDLLFKSMDMPYAEEISERMKKMMPPQLQDQEGEDNPQVQQVKQQASQAIQQLQQQLEAAHQAMQQAEQEAKQLEAKANDAEGKRLYDMKKLEIDAYNAETNRLKVEIDAMQNAQPFSPERLQMMEDAVAKLIDGMQPPELEQPANEPLNGGFLTPEETPEQPLQ